VLNKFVMKRIMRELPHGLLGIFENMEIAEEEITAAIKRHKQKQQEINGAFGILWPTVFLKANGNKKLYRWHCKELLERVAAGDEDTRPGTKAEVISMISETSYKAPLTSEWGALYGQLFLEIFPEQKRKLFNNDTGWIHGQWPTQLAELLQESRRLTADESRKIKTRKEKPDGQQRLAI
jgi:hypothetical protein